MQDSTTLLNATPRRQRAIQEANQKAASAGAVAGRSNNNKASYQRIEFSFPDPEFGGFRPVSQSHQYPSARSVHSVSGVMTHVRS